MVAPSVLLRTFRSIESVKLEFEDFSDRFVSMPNHRTEWKRDCANEELSVENTTRYQWLRLVSAKKPRASFSTYEK